MFLVRRVGCSLWRTLRDRAERSYARAPYRTRALVWASAAVLAAGLITVHLAHSVALAQRTREMAIREAGLYANLLATSRNHPAEVLAGSAAHSSLPLLLLDDQGRPAVQHHIAVSPEATALFTSRARARGDTLLVERPDGSRWVLLYSGDPRAAAQSGFAALGVAALGLLGLLALAGVRIVQATDRSLLWVGLARETAHQLGTPISSLLGWIELLRLPPGEGPPLTTVVDEMAQDLRRLHQISERFNQIGSRPELIPVEPDSLIQKLHDATVPRVPRGSHAVKLEMELGSAPRILANVELLGWVLENLVRNALDALDRPDGRIVLRSRRMSGHRVLLEVQDNGKGIPREHWKDVFVAGWSTKQRGWGLGLALARRIVEQYHGGSIRVGWSRLGEGTTFAIVLPAIDHPKSTSPTVGSPQFS